MARVQRILGTNEILASTTILSATSFQPGFPPSHLRDPLRSKTWRSKVGWTIVAGFNDELDFTEAGNARVATITPGQYATGATMATAIQTAMNAAPGATNTYTVTYAANEFTIARATGAAAVVLKFGDGANLTSSVHIDLGFLSVNQTGDTSYTGDHAVYQSRQAIFADLGEITAVEVGALVRCNADATYQGSDTTLVGVGAGASPAFSADLTAASPYPLSLDSEARISFDSTGGRRYWRLLLDGTEVEDGYTEVGVWFVGVYWEPSRAYIQGDTREAEPLTEQMRGDQGAIFRNVKDDPDILSVQYRRLTLLDYLNFRIIEDGSEHLFFCVDGEHATPQDHVMYGVLQGKAQARKTVGDGTPPDRYDLGLTFLESLG